MTQRLPHGGGRGPQHAPLGVHRHCEHGPDAILPFANEFTRRAAAIDGENLAMVHTAHVKSFGFGIVGDVFGQQIFFRQRKSYLAVGERLAVCRHARLDLLESVALADGGKIRFCRNIPRESHVGVETQPVERSVLVAQQRLDGPLVVNHARMPGGQRVELAQIVTKSGVVFRLTRGARRTPKFLPR